MPLYLWDIEAPLPVISTPLSIQVRSEADVSHIAAATQNEPDEIARRLNQGHRAYIAFQNDTPLGYGWVATRQAVLCELDLSFSILSGNQYFWDFATVPNMRGQGVYPTLLQKILKFERTNAESFWIAHAPENHASERGIRAAGFAPVGKLTFLKHYTQSALAAHAHHIVWAERAATLFNVDVLIGETTQGNIAPCWRCVINAKRALRFVPPACWSETCGCVAEDTR